MYKGVKHLTKREYDYAHRKASRTGEEMLGLWSGEEGWEWFQESGYIPPYVQWFDCIVYPSGEVE